MSMIGAMIAAHETAKTAIAAIAMTADRTSRSCATRRLSAAPRPVPSSSENSVTVSE